MTLGEFADDAYCEVADDGADVEYEIADDVEYEWQEDGSLDKPTTAAGSPRRSLRLRGLAPGHLGVDDPTYSFTTAAELIKPQTWLATSISRPRKRLRDQPQQSHRSPNTFRSFRVPTSECPIRSRQRKDIFAERKRKVLCADHARWRYSLFYRYCNTLAYQTRSSPACTLMDPPPHTTSLIPSTPPSQIYYVHNTR